MTIKISKDDKMIEIPIGKKKMYCNRVMIEIMADIYTESEDEQQAGTMSEDIGEELVRYLDNQIKFADGCPGVDEVQITSWAARNLDAEEMKEE